MTLDNQKDHSLGFLIGRAHRVLANQLNRLFADAQHDLNVEQWIILRNLWKLDGQSQQSLANNVYKDKASITRTLDGMVRRNLIVKVADQMDKRNKLIFLTHKGRTLEEDTVSIAEEMLEQATRQISKEDLDICKEVLEILYQNQITK